MKFFDFLFPIFKALRSEDEVRDIAQRNLELSKELKDKPSMSTKEIIEYAKNKKQLCQSTH